MTRGSCKLGIGDRELALSAGQLVIFQPGQDHELIQASEDLGLFVVALRPEFRDRALGARALSGIEPGEITQVELRALEAELSGVGQLCDGTSSDERLARLFGRALDRAPKARATSRRVFESLRSELHLSEGALAERFRTTASGVSRQFRDSLGVSLVEYRARLRLMRFIELVDRGQPLSRAALDADFGSYAQCHRVFRRTLRCSPQAYFGGVRVELNEKTAPNPR